eukprot:CAMPEP_0197843822 /NCGR_PEP_ID=MMETSP1438-20131217/770_1 /TAXON_ID=1461541 /ORGANISM="Pterosperma sp., Strain CCMP1384" /LENGTH=340 /DNA_ID=CAMNT_0043454223 /DNA_START=166 /DNA_END=1185 /DNA_ORIENTATION=-
MSVAAGTHLSGRLCLVKSQRPKRFLVKNVSKPVLQRRASAIKAEGESDTPLPDAPTKSAKSDEYIWNQNWKKEMNMKKNKGKESNNFPKKRSEEGGFLNFNRASAMDMMDMDLSDQRLQKTQSTAERQSADYLVQTTPKQAANAAEKRAKRTKWRYAPTRKEQKEMAKYQENAEKWGSKPAPKMDPVSVQEREEKEKLAAERAREDLKDYSELKLRLFGYTFLCGALLVGGAYGWKGETTAISAGAGVAFSLLYLRLLSRGVDQMSGGGGGAPPSLLVPAIIFMGYNRWNALYADYYGVTLEILPLLMGFFTYKAGTLIETFVTVLTNSDEQVDDSPKDW